MDTSKLFIEMTRYYSGSPERISHFTKVHGFAALIGKTERLDNKTQFILEAAAITHDIGIKAAEEIYHSTSGVYQQELGPDIAEKMLDELGFERDITKRVCYLIAHHHTYDAIDGLDYQILVEADFLVNIFEEGFSKDAARSVLSSIFKTTAGRTLCAAMYDL